MNHNESRYKKAIIDMIKFNDSTGLIAKEWIEPYVKDIERKNKELETANKKLMSLIDKVLNIATREGYENDFKELKLKKLLQM